ncbi:hypothetical protein P153DRAFT_401405 [Dothidotthia symphoricarpi CBS 119687]|uniref:ATP-grasp domain-containing protein n=1 Tax=Dothidotthia symphoricarpi CBS 119687 TaxID=1392245 RepID=A0A6A5ZZS6_9PLEO|nr:uncharacterized protein P153DRAFT_401405 [Dothidotthia symphoricarpi CBS 119687]KAF2123831.1 hypothetical protein P153DRAFT_401405 [Dothidotthia symphoricarpi CBS 119687]
MPPPPVELSTTLSDLYSLDGGDANDIALCYTIPAPSRRALSLSCPLSQKYAYQSPRSTKVGPDTTARFVLGCMSQFYGFVAGPMDLHLFDIDATKMERAYQTFSWTAAERSHRQDARRTYERVQASQRPNLHSIETPGQAVELGKTKKLATASPIDFLNHDPQITVVPQEAHWKMLSKRTLAESGLPTPPTQIIESQLVALSNGAAVDPVNNPFYQRGLSDPYANVDYVPDKDSDKETTRMMAALVDRPLPFVVKLPHGYGGHAVFVDLLPGKSIAVSFFVTKAGRAVFVSASEEVHNEAGSWTGALMDYAAQDALSVQSNDIINTVAAYVYEKGFYGPMGVDVMTDDQGKIYVIDLNVRHTGSYSLGLMKKHFLENQKLPFGGLLAPIPIMGDRDAFERRFADEIESGRLVITAWCHSKVAGGLVTYNAAGMIAGAETREQFLEFMDRLNAITIKR